MEDKTAKIPSLKEFKESRKEKDAQRERSQSMQTKKQMQRSITKGSGGVEKRSPREASRRKPENETDARTRQAERSRAQRQSPPGRRPAPPREAPQRREAEQRTYVRDRLQEEKRQKRPSAPVTETYPPRETARRESEPLRQYRSQRGNPPPRRERVPQNANRRPPQSSRPQTKRTVPQKPKKPKKPLSPKARKLRNILVYAGIILVVLIIALVLSLTVLFRTEQIVVSGNEIYTAEEIIEVSGLSRGQNIFTANKSAAAERIEKACPYIEKADVYFVVPDAIKIDVKMATPSYMVESQTGLLVVSDMGKVLEFAATDDEAAIPVVEGASVAPKSPGEYLEYSSDTVTTAMQEVFSAFKALNCKNITAVNIEEKEDSIKLRYVYDGRIVVYLGTPDRIYHKIHTADTIIREKLDVGGSKPVGELDVSRSYDTKKSYFNEYSILADNVAPPATTAKTEVTETTETPNYDSYYVDDTPPENTDYGDGYAYE